VQGAILDLITNIHKRDAYTRRVESVEAPVPFSSKFVSILGCWPEFHHLFCGEKGE